MDQNHLSITLNSCFDRYFDFILDGRLDENDFRESINKDLNTFKKKIQKWNEVRRTASDLQLRFENFKTFLNKDQFEQVINGIIYFTELPAAENILYNNNFNVNNFVEKIGGLDVQNNTIISQYYGKKVELFRTFVATIFDYKIHPMGNTFIFQLAEYIIKDSYDKFVFTNDEIKDFLKNAFIYVLENSEEFTNELMNYYAATARVFTDKKQTEITPIGDGATITEKFRDFIIEKGLVGLLKYNFFPYQGSPQLGYTLGGWPKIIFGSFEEFDKKLEEATGIDEAKEEYYNFCKQMDGEKHVKEFDFKFLKKDDKQ